MQMCSLPRWWSLITLSLCWHHMMVPGLYWHHGGPRGGARLSVHCHEAHRGKCQPASSAASCVPYKAGFICEISICVSKISRLVCRLKSFELQGNCNIFRIISQSGDREGLLVASSETSWQWTEAIYQAGRPDTQLPPLLTQGDPVGSSL